MKPQIELPFGTTKFVNKRTTYKTLSLVRAGVKREMCLNRGFAKMWALITKGNF